MKDIKRRIISLSGNFVNRLKLLIIFVFSEICGNSLRCPLCHDNIELEENCWKKHLMGESPCTKNTRIKFYNQKQVKIQI